MNNITVYGPGCAKCNALADITKQAMEELNLNIPLRKVTDAMQFAVSGVLITPALAIDGKILVSGKVPSKAEIKKILQEAVQADSAPQKSCNCSRSAESELPQENIPQVKESSCCSKNCCDDKASQKCSGWKKAVVWIVALLILLSIIKVINRRINESREEPIATAVMQKTGIEAVYYEYGVRCATCIRMETWTKDAIEKNFPLQLKDGKLAFHSIPVDKESIDKYKLTTKSLILKDWKDGTETQWVNLDRIWNLNKNEQEFKEYVVQSIREKLNATH